MVEKECSTAKISFPPRPVGGEGETKIAPRGSQDPPTQRQGVQSPLRRLPKKPPRPSQQSSFSRVLKNNCFNMNIFVGSSPRSCQDQHIIRAFELLSLHTSQPPSLRVPAANCLGGIREAQTINPQSLGHLFCPPRV